MNPFVLMDQGALCGWFSGRSSLLRIIWVFRIRNGKLFFSVTYVVMKTAEDCSNLLNLGVLHFCLPVICRVGC